MSRLQRFTTLAALILLLAACVPIPPLEGTSTQAPAEQAALPATLAPPATTPPEPTSTATEAPPTAAPTLAPTATPTVEPTLEVALAQAAEPATQVPTLAPTATRVPTRTATPRPTSTRQPTATRPLPTRTPIPTPTIDRNIVIITEDDIAESIAGGAAAQQGVTAQNLKVDFANGKMRVTADRLGYGLLSLQNLDLTGRLVATNGVLGLVVESMSPRGLAASLVPTVANQALAQLGAQWYVEEVKTLDGRVELRVR